MLRLGIGLVLLVVGGGTASSSYGYVVVGEEVRPGAGVGGISSAEAGVGRLGWLVVMVCSGGHCTSNC